MGGKARHLLTRGPLGDLKRSMRVLGFFFLLLVFGQGSAVAQESHNTSEMIHSLAANEIILLRISSRENIFIMKSSWGRGLKIYAVTTGGSGSEGDPHDVRSVQKISLHQLEVFLAETRATPLKLALGPAHLQKLRKGLSSGDLNQFENCRPFDLYQCESARPVSGPFSDLSLFDLSAVAATISFAQIAFSTYKLTVGERLLATTISLAGAVVAVDLLTRIGRSHWGRTLRLSRFNDPDPGMRWFKVVGISLLVTSAVSCPFFIKTFAEHRHVPRSGPPSVQITPQELSQARAHLERQRADR